jgi:hypothetical protein
MAPEKPTEKRCSPWVGRLGVLLVVAALAGLVLLCDWLVRPR